MSEAHYFNSRNELTNLLREIASFFGISIFAGEKQLLNLFMIIHYYIHKHDFELEQTFFREHENRYKFLLAEYKVSFFAS